MNVIKLVSLGVLCPLFSPHLPPSATVAAVPATASSSAAPPSSPFAPSSFFRRRRRRRRHHDAVLPPASTDALRRWYARPPHDVRLYDALHVAPNATLAEIQRSWRRLSRTYHPDKAALRRRRRAGTGDAGDTGAGGGAKRGSDDGRHDDECRRVREDQRPHPPPPPPPPPPPLHPTSVENGNAANKEASEPSSDEMHSEVDEEDYARQKLAEVTHAYEILSDDHTRLLYHRYGLVGGTEAALRLLAGQRGPGDGPGAASDSAPRASLLEWMGYPPGASSQRLPERQARQRRLAYLAAALTERLRPLVEGAVPQDRFADEVFRECHALKTGPLGAQILRCVGRAYRVEGYRALLRSRRRRGERCGRSGRRDGVARRARARREEERLSDRWRSAKHYAAAALSSGKLVLMERRVRRLEEGRARRRRRREEEDRARRRGRATREGAARRLEATRGERRGERGDEGDGTTSFVYNIGELPGEEDATYGNHVDSDFPGEEGNIGAFSDDDEEDFLRSFHDEDNDDDDDQQQDDLEQELQYVQNRKKHAALLSVIQMEALWKITKIDLDRTVREACRRILAPAEERGWSAFCPQEPSPPPDAWRPRRRPPPRPPPRGGDRRRERGARRERPLDGWVGTTGNVVHMEVGRLRAAAAMALVGDIMVQCSKEGTSWNK